MNVITTARDRLAQALVEFGAPPWAGTRAIGVVVLVVFVLLAWLSYVVAKHLLAGGIHKIARRSKNAWDDRIAERGVLFKLARIAPALVLYGAVGFLESEIAWLATALRRAVGAYIVIVIERVFVAVLDALHDGYLARSDAKRRPIKGVVQLVKVLSALAAAVLVITVVFDQPIVGIVGGLGAMSAVLLLVFRDSILGFVSGIQLTTNDLVQIGDWIEMPRYDADGDVIDITLQSIKVRNWDKTITTIPIYALVSDSFRNWRGMTESGGRRIKRAVSIDMRSVRFLDAATVHRYRRYSRIRAYLDQRTQEIDAYNREHNIDIEDSVSGRRMTNLGVFRAYMEAYLTGLPHLRHDMTFMVRQLPPGPNGLPLEVYVFSADQRWVEFERIQADIFDHLLAALPEFGLRVFQAPSGGDVADMAAALDGGLP